MARTEATVTSAWDPERTFDYMARFDNVALWDPGVVSAQAVEDGPPRLGSRYEVVVRVGRPVKLVYEIVEMEPGRRVVLRAHHPLLTATDSVVVTPTAGGSEVSYVAEVTLAGPLRLLDRGLQGRLNGVVERARQGLQTVLTGT